MTLARITPDDPDHTNLPARADTDSWTTVVAHVSRLAQEVAATSFVPKGLRNDVPATTAAILYGREVGLPPMTALTQIHVIEGRPGMAAEGMRALVLAAGHELAFDESTGARCTMRARRRGSNTWTSVTWTIDMGRAAGLTMRDNWKKYPRAMLVARATTDLCRMVFPDVIHGFRSVEEIDDMAAGETPAPEPTPSGTVQRKTRKRAAPRPPEPVAAPAPSSGPVPPLPGEEGPPDVSAGATPPADTPAPQVPAPRPPADQDDDPGPRMANRPTLKLMFREFTRLGVDDDQRDKRLRILADIAGRPLASSNDMTQEEATRAVTMLTASRDLDALAEIIHATPEELPDEG